MTGRLLDVAGEAVDAGTRWLGAAGEEWAVTRFKESGEEVTDADVEVERRVGEVLRRRTPGLPIVGEESFTGGGLPARCWVLDPIDGTMNFTRGGPMHALSLALVEDGRPVLGVVHAPALGRRWTSEPAGNPSGEQELGRALVAVTGMGGGRQPYAAALVARLHEDAYRIRMHGAMSLDLIAVADGWVDGCLCVGAKPWDVAGGAAIALARGLAVLGAGGREFTFDSPVLAAGHPALARELIAVWESMA